MAHIVVPKDWNLPERLITPEHSYLNRRSFLRQLRSAGLLAAAGSLSAQPAPPATNRTENAGRNRYPAKRNPDFNPSWRLSDEKIAAQYNNFYEFSTAKDQVHRLVNRFTTAPWSIEIGGLVQKPLKVDADELISLMLPLEERVYRFRCVEAWAMIVPWTGFPFRRLAEKVEPRPEAKFVRFVTFFRPNEAPGFSDASYPWPYTEGLRLDEAMHPLTLVTTGIYGKPLPKQHGAPIRMIVPWKYGYKSIKSMVRIEFVATQPRTLWETMAPREYPFESNVNPAVPHPRWSQASERLIDSGDRVRTQPYNGYGKYVGSLYG